MDIKNMSKDKDKGQVDYKYRVRDKYSQQHPKITYY